MGVKSTSLLVRYCVALNVSVSDLHPSAVMPAPVVTSISTMQCLFSGADASDRMPRMGCRAAERPC